MRSLIDHLRTWRLQRAGLSRGEFDQLEQFASARGNGVLPGDLISKPDTKRLEQRGLVYQCDDGRRVIDGSGVLLWLDVQRTPRRSGNWLNVW